MKAGWKVKALGEVADVGGGNPAPQSKELFEGGKYPFFRTSDIGKIRFGEIESALDYLNDDGTRGMTSVPRGTILLPKSGASTFLNHRVITKVEGYASSHLATVRASGLETDTRFLWYFLTTVSAQDLIQDHSYPSLQLGLIKGIPIPLPPLEEQKRIVAVLDAAFEGLSRARAHAQANLKNARELFESGLDAAFDNSADDFKLLTFGDKGLLNIIDGDRGANYPKKEDFLEEGHCLFLNTKNVRPDGFDFSQCMFIDEQKDRVLRKGRLSKRDVLLTTRGTIGNIAIFDDSVPYDEIRINSGMLILRPNEDRIIAEYLFEVLRSRFVKAQISEQTSGAAQPQLPIGTLVGISLPVPTSLVAQKRIVERLQEIGTQADGLQSHYRAKLADLDALRQALLQKAFAGELT